MSNTLVYVFIPDRAMRFPHLDFRFRFAHKVEYVNHSLNVCSIHGSCVQKKLFSHRKLVIHNWTNLCLTGTRNLHELNILRLRKISWLWLHCASLTLFCYRGVSHFVKEVKSVVRLSGEFPKGD